MSVLMVSVLLLGHGPTHSPSTKRRMASNKPLTVLPDGPHEIVGQELGGAYYEKAAPVIELQVARAGYRMAAWLDLIADEFEANKVQQGGWQEL